MLCNNKTLFIKSEKRILSQTYENLVLLMPSIFDKKQNMVQNIICWKISWVNNNEISNYKEAKNYK